MQKLNESVVTSIKNKINYFGDRSNLHGVGHVVSQTPIPGFKRLFWLTILVGCGVGCGRILSEALGLYTQGSVSFSADTNYLTFDTPFPAITLCEGFDTTRLTEYITVKELPPTLTPFFKEVFFYNNKYCKTCMTCKMNSTCVENFLELVKDYRLACEEMLTECWWGEQHFKCCDRFRPIQTEYGGCFVFNSRSRLTSNESMLVVNRQVGLPSLVFTAIRTVSIRVHSPDDEVSIKTDRVSEKVDLIVLASEVNVTLKAEATTSDVSINLLDPVKRGCLLVHEKPAFAQHWPFPRYSYNACVLYCRAMKQVEVCNCTHHFMPQQNGIDVCDIQGLACLYKNRDELILNYNCGCPMACEEINYETLYTTYNRKTNLSNKVVRASRVLVRLHSLPTLRVRRHAIRDLLGVVVDVGGVGGVFFGASLLSVIEIVYLLCLRRET
ncbi:sodium channel protein Nach-like [Choristoneura fumiferana]|uniref:sodium channel protein Nach-like n=1 Tax=Choristoneura fumiferana TaxID=7141 RepID=UPI003D158BA2